VKFLSFEYATEALSALARLKGLSVPSYRFGKPDAELSNNKFSYPIKLIEMWALRFPEGSHRYCFIDNLKRSDFPLIWIDDDGYIAVIKSRLANGDFALESLASGSDELLPTEIAAKGKFLLLSSISIDSDDEASGHMSANAWFWHAIKKKKKVFIEAIGATFLMNLLGVVTAMYTMQVYDRVIPTQGFSTLWVLTFGVAMSIVFEFMMRQVRSIMTERATKVIDMELSGVFFSKALSIRMDARPPTVGTFASQIRHFESVRNFMTSAVLFVLADVPFALMFILVVALIGGYLAIVPLITVPIAIFISLFFRGVIERLTNEHMKESNEKNGLLIEAVDGIESIKASGAEWKIYDLYMSLTKSISSSELKLKVLSARASHLSMLVQQVNYVALIAVGAYAISNGDLSMGGLIASSIIMGRIFNPLAQVPNLVVQWKHAQISLKALDGIMEMPSDRAPDARLVVPDQMKGHLAMEDVLFAYSENSAKVVVPKIYFSPGEKVAVIGSVGSGKSTFLKLISGLYAPFQGRVLIDGVDIQQLAPEFVREHVGYLPQEVRLFNGTLRSNLTIGLPTPSDSTIIEACEKTGLADFIKAHPDGLELMIAEGGRGLSGGQKQLVGLTRMLMMSPSIMLLDEPTASMDGELEAKVMKHLFQSLPSDTLSVVVTHKKSVLAHVDRVIVINQGQVVMNGPRDDVFKQIAELKTKAQASVKPN